MALDKTAPERLRLERGPDEGKYRQRRGAQRFRLRGGAPAVQPAITGLARIRRGMTNATLRW